MAGRRYEGLPVPFWFRDKSFLKFKRAVLVSDDVVLSSLVKGGTTWMQKVLYCILHGVSDDGQILPTTDKTINARGQLYPEALPLDAKELEVLEQAPKGSTEAFVRAHFGPFSVDDLLNQPAPRLFSTHLFGEKFLPDSLFDTGGDKGKGRLIVVARNLKDVMCSLHFFRGEPKDGWLGNEHGPGSFKRYMDPDCPNAYGSTFTWLKENQRVVDLLGPDRACVVYYEALKQDLPAQVDRIASFLGMSLSRAKRDAVAKACGFDAMSANKERAMLFRKGKIGDWKNQLDAKHWTEFDKVFDERLGECPMAQPLYHYQNWAVSGMPPLKSADQPLNCDPRDWGSFIRVTLQNGMVVRDNLISPAQTGGNTFIRPPSEFNGKMVSPKDDKGAASDGSGVFVAEPGRYHLFVSGVCPWATSVRAARHMLGLEDAIPMHVADGQSGAGWVFLDGVDCPPWNGIPGPFFLHEVYQKHDCQATCRLTVPILWDSKTHQIISNDSWSIIKMLASAFEPFAKRRPDVPLDAGGLFPKSLLTAIEEKHQHIYKQLLNGVYRSGVAWVKQNETAAKAAAAEVFEELARLDDELTNKPFLLGEHITAVDIRLMMTLVRFDAAYHIAFKLATPRNNSGILLGDGYPGLRSYVRRMYPHVEPVLEWPTFRQYYRWTVGLASDQPIPSYEPIIASAQGNDAKKRKIMI